MDVLCQIAARPSGSLARWFLAAVSAVSDGFADLWGSIFGFLIAGVLVVALAVGWMVYFRRNERLLDSQSARLFEFYECRERWADRMIELLERVVGQKESRRRE